MLNEALLAAALTFRPFHGDVEAPEERTERLTLIAQAITEAVSIATCDRSGPNAPRDAAEEKDGAKQRQSETDASPSATPCKRLWPGDPRQLAFLLLSQAYFETRLAKHVHDGNCRAHIGECDSGRAISLWQLQWGPHLPKEEWEKLGEGSLEATRNAAVHAARSLGRGYNYCRSMRGAIALYATGSTCNWRPAARRAAFAQKLLTQF